MLSVELVRTTCSSIYSCVTPTRISPREKKKREREKKREKDWESLINEAVKNSTWKLCACIYYTIDIAVRYVASGCTVRNFNKPRDDRIEIQRASPATPVVLPLVLQSTSSSRDKSGHTWRSWCTRQVRAYSSDYFPSSSQKKSVFYEAVELSARTTVEKAKAINIRRDRRSGSVDGGGETLSSRHNACRAPILFSEIPISHRFGSEKEAGRLPANRFIPTSNRSFEVAAAVSSLL